MYYSNASLEKLEATFATIDERLNSLIEKYYSLKLKNTNAREHAMHGYARRLKIATRCIHNVFKLIPPAREELPSKEEIADATISIQSFVFNIFGAIDNLAWVWVSETGQKRDDGTPIPKKHIGLWPENASVRATLSSEFQKYLVGLDKWFDHLQSLRHSLAHRIPLYIPPHVISDDDLPAYRELEEKAAEAIKNHDFEGYEQLMAEQLKLGRFRPWIQQSFEENSVPIVFHPQMLSDFATIEELGTKMLEEFSKAP